MTERSLFNEPSFGADTANEETLLRAMSTITRKARPEPSGPPDADVIDYCFGFSSGEVGTALTATVPPAMLRSDFPARLSGAFLEETSETPISGSATVVFEVRPDGGSWGTLGSISLSGATEASDEVLSGWPRFIQTADRIRARLTAAATVQALTATLRARKWSQDVVADLTMALGSGDTLVTGSGDTVILRR